MSDLISRSELLKAFNNKNVQITFDLPVEEVLGDDVDLDDFAMLVQDAIQAYKKMAIDTIKNQPTAYSVGKIVEELEKELSLADKEKERCTGESHLQFDSAKGYASGISTAIGIVKQGNAEIDNVCEWKAIGANDNWATSCYPNATHNVFGVAWFEKCPYCGRKLKIEGDNDDN